MTSIERRDCGGISTMTGIGISSLGSSSPVSVPKGIDALPFDTRVTVAPEGLGWDGERLADGEGFGRGRGFADVDPLLAPLGDGSAGCGFGAGAGAGSGSPKPGGKIDSGLSWLIAGRRAAHAAPKTSAALKMFDLFRIDRNRHFNPLGRSFAINHRQDHKQNRNDSQDQQPFNVPIHMSQLVQPRGSIRLLPEVCGLCIAPMTRL